MPVDDMICFVKPFFKKGDQKPRQDLDLLKRRLYLMNIPYDTTRRELVRLVKEFIDFDDIVIPRNKDGYTSGYAFIYLKNVSDMDKAIDFIDGRHIRSR
jgi:RNA recognition motif-containing protein